MVLCKPSVPILCAAILAFLMLIPLPLAHASRTDALLDALASSDEAARVQARQQLPRESVQKIAPRLVQLLSHEDHAIWRTAYNILSDLANASALPGHEDDQAFLTRELMPLLAPSSTDHLKLQALRLLPVTIPDTWDPAPVTALLNDTQWREKARAALVETATPPARAALRAALAGSLDPAFQRDLLLGLAQLHDTNAATLATPLCSSPDAQVRAAAALLLSTTGNPSNVASVRAVRDAASPDTYADADDALLRLAESIALRGGNYEHAMALYWDVFRHPAGTATQFAAVAGLSRFGDDSVIPPLVDYFNTHADTDPRMLLTAFRNINGAAACKRMAESWSLLPDKVRMPLLDVFASKRSPILLPALLAASDHNDPAFRAAAISALGQCGQADAVAALAVIARSGEAPWNTQAIESIQNASQDLAAQGDAPGAGAAWLALLNAAQDDEMRATALQGLASWPTPDAHEAVAACLASAALRETAIPAMLAVAESLAKANRKEDALTAYGLLRDAQPDADTVAIVAERLGQLGAEAEAARMMGSVLSWKLAGPFPWGDDADWERAFVGEPDTDPANQYDLADGKKGLWKDITSSSEVGLVDLTSVYGMLNRSFAYARAVIHVENDVDVVFRLGSDDGYRFWVNGELIKENRVDRGLAVDQDAAPARLVAGDNVLLLKISQGGGGWAYCVRLVATDGKRVEFTYPDAQ